MNIARIGHFADESVAALLRAPLVTVEGRYFVFRDETNPGFIYDFAPVDALDTLRWVSHMAGKTWVTTKHLEQFALLAQQTFGEGQ